MNRVYLLLRNNKQSGPHSLEELISLAPEPFDLIWVEGKSIGWAYPTEIDGLKIYFQSAEILQPKMQAFEESPAYVPSVNKHTSQKITPVNIHVSLPNSRSQRSNSFKDAVDANNLETKAEELRKKVQEFTVNSSSAANEPKTRYNRSFDKVEEEYTNWVYNNKIKKKKNFPSKSLTIALVCIALGIGGYFLIQSFSNTDIVGIQVVDQQHPTQQNITPDSVLITPQNINIEESAETDAPTNFPVKQNNNIAKSNEKKETPLLDEPSDKLPQSPAPVENKTEPAQETNSSEIPESQDETAREPEAVTPKEKKKTLAEKIDGFFEKIGNNKKQESTDNLPNSGEDGPERKSKRRDDQANAPVEQIDINTLVDITANNPDNWMMGIKGLKLTLRNRSNESIKTASVEIKYYNDHNSLIEKQVVYFTNVLPKNSLTISAPDQRLADHFEFKLIAVNTKEEGYAKR